MTEKRFDQATEQRERFEQLRERRSQDDAVWEAALRMLKGRDGWSPEYVEYHEKVVEACCKLMGENQRQFFDDQCTYEEEFESQTDPDEVAWAQWEALT